MSKNKYPEAIYGTRNGGTMTPKQRDGFGGMARRYAYNLGYADGWVDRGKSVRPVPAGWSNLTEAIKAGERIDWERLDGLEAKCVHPEVGTLTHKLERYAQCPADDFTGWYKEDYPTGWSGVFSYSWEGAGGWSLWAKGDLPLRKQTADQLEPGTGFCGTHPESGEKLKGMVVVPSPGARKAVIFTRSVPHVAATDVEVIEAYGVGTYYKPEGDA